MERPETLYVEVEEIERRTRNLDRKLDLILKGQQKILSQIGLTPAAKLVLTLGTPQPQ